MPHRMKSLLTSLFALICVVALRAGEIQDAAATGDLERVRALVSAAPTAVNTRDRGTTALHEAARAGHLVIVKFLIENGAALNATDISGATPLRLAIGYHRADVALFLKQQGAVEKIVAAPAKVFPSPSPVVTAKLPNEVQPLPKSSMTPSLFATNRIASAPPRVTNAVPARPQVLASLPPTKTNAPVAITNDPVADRGMLQVIYPIHEAARLGDVEQIKFLLKSFPDLIAATDEKGMTPLHIAAANKQFSAVQALVGVRAKVNARNDIGQTPLHLAARAGDLRTVQLMLTNRAEVNVHDSVDVTPLLAATAPSDKEEFQATDLTAQVRFNAVQRRAAAMQMHEQQLALARALVAHGAQVNVRNRAGATPLIQAVRLRNDSLVDFLLRSGADPNAVDLTGKVAPLHLASGRGLTNIIALLLNAKANVNLTDSRGETPLGYALHEGHRGVAALLKQHGANIGSSRALSTVEQSLVDFYQRTEAALQHASVSDRGRLILEMTANRNDAIKLFPRHSEAAARVMDVIRREIKDHKPVADADQGKDVWRVRPEPPSLQAQDWINRGWISREVPVMSIVVDRVGRTSRPGDYCFVNQRWVLLPPLDVILAQQQSAALK